MDTNFGILVRFLGVFLGMGINYGTKAKIMGVTSFGFSITSLYNILYGYAYLVRMTQD